MSTFKFIRNNNGSIEKITTHHQGLALLSSPILNKGTAFSDEERETLKLRGLLPSRVETLEEQAERAYLQYQSQPSKFAKYIFLEELHNHNDTLFFKLVGDHIKEMLPIVYTPVVGEAVQKFSHELRRARGLYISYPERDHIDEIFENYTNNDIELVIVTDGERILGLGDQGVGGVNICIGKLAVYTLCAGVNPHIAMPIVLDVGTNNKSLLENPKYLGWRHARLTGKEYDDFIEQFVTALQKKWPNIFLHWEDFGRNNARRVLDKYRGRLCTFNDDMQGTGVVTLSSLLSAMHVVDQKLSDQQFVVFGSGTAGTGISDQIVSAMMHEGISEEEARSKIYMLGSKGLLFDDMPTLQYFQKPYAKNRSILANWKINNPDFIDLEDAVNNVKPTILIGCSTVPGAFTESIIKTMAKYVERPIVLPLSNPTSKTEGIPADILKWTNGKAIIATGSPFDDVEINGKKIPITQCNNAFAFPGMGLGILAVNAKRVTDNMLFTACQTLSDCSPVKQDKSATLLPSLNDIHDVSFKIAKAVAEAAIQEGLAEEQDIDKAIRHIYWDTQYFPISFESDV